MPPVYASEENALRRVLALITHGIWPGIRKCDGGWELTYDPVIAEDELRWTRTGPS